MNPMLLSAWNETVRQAPDAPAVIDVANDVTFSRGELDRRAADWYETHGRGLARRMVVFSESNGAGWLQIFLGLLKADAVIVSLDPGEPVSAQRHTATAIGASAVWGGGVLQPTNVRRVAARDGRRLVKLTSGSTGKPRALAFTDAQMGADGRQVCGGMDIRPEDVNFGLIPFGHSYGLGNLVMPLLIQGTPIVTGVAAFPYAMAEAIARWRPTIFPAVPALLRALVLSELPPEQLVSLRTVISAGAPLEPEIAVRFEEKFGLKVHSFYGSSETGGITYDKTGDAARTGRSVGRPLPDVRLKFGRGGRFTVESAAVFTIGNRQRGANGFGRHQPADIGELTLDGELALTGRAGRFVKIAGRRLNLAEVEHALKRLPGVRDAHVIAHTERADALAAAVATEQAGETLRTALRERLAAWKVPKKIVTLPAFPLTARGKTDTRALREILGA